MKNIGFFINPIAGMGGKVGLKGTDSSVILQEAIKRGAHPIADERAKRFLKQLSEFPEYKNIKFIIPKGIMGEDIFSSLTRSTPTPFKRVISDILIPSKTSSQDTYSVSKRLKKLKVDLLIFVGGDGTARDVLAAVGSDFPILGVPSGVKMHSGVFAQGIEKAVHILRKFVNEEVQLIKSEIVDLDEDAFRHNRLSTTIFGVALVPQIPALMQPSKLCSFYDSSEEANINGIIQTYKELIDNDTLYLLGSGSTIKEIAQVFNEEIHSQKSLLGIDAVLKQTILGKDLMESEIINLINTTKARSIRIVVTIIGMQGFIFGRGNQQLSSEVIKLVGIENIDVIATRSKLENIPEKKLFVDTGDPNLDQELSGYIKVLVDYNTYTMVRVEAV